MISTEEEFCQALWNPSVALWSSISSNDCFNVDLPAMEGNSIDVKRFQGGELKAK